MLKRNKKHGRVELRGIEPQFLKQWHVDLMVDLKPFQIWTAYDDPKEYDVVRASAKMLTDAGFSRHTLRCYCLIGYPGDSKDAALSRLTQILELGMFPFAMLYRDKNGNNPSYDWRVFQRSWARPALIARMARSILKS